MSNKITMPWEERPAGCKDVMWRYSAESRNRPLPYSVVEQHFQQCSGAV